MPDWIDVFDSTRISAMAYDELSETIFVRFRDGAEWSYSGCPRPIWDEFSAPGTSRGSYINLVLNGYPNGRYG